MSHTLDLSKFYREDFAEQQPTSTTPVPAPKGPTTSSPVPPTAPKGPTTSSPVPPTAPAPKGPTTSSPVPPTAPAPGLTTSSPVPPTAPAPPTASAPVPPTAPAPVPPAAPAPPSIVVVNAPAPAPAAAAVVPKEPVWKSTGFLLIFGFIAILLVVFVMFIIMRPKPTGQYGGNGNCAAGVRRVIGGRR